MGDLKKILGYASIGAAKVAGKKAWESDSYLESAMKAAETGLWAESARNFLRERPKGRAGRPFPSRKR